MFQELIASSPSKASRKPLTLVFSALIHGFFILLLIAIPLVYPETLANLQTLIAPPPPLAAPKKAVVKLISSAGKRQPVATRPITLFTPDFIPATIDMTPMRDSALNSGDPNDISRLGFPNGGSGGVGNFLEGLPDGSARAVLPPEPPASTDTREAHITRVKRGGEVQHANLVHQVKPSYPHMAIIMRVQGAVILEAIIDREGRVENLKVLSGHPLLIRASCEAVQQWRYRPTLLNGEPVDVLTQVTVNFNLGTP